ncbi:MAG: putative dsRNA-binding protein, partial [Thermoflexales bacterium]
YKLVSTIGPDHARVFTSEVWLGDLLAATGAGQSKQVAEQVAAREAVAREDVLAREWLALHPPALQPGAAQ